MSVSAKGKRKNLPVERAKCELLGDVHRLRYEASRKQMVADVLLSPTDVRRLLDTMSTYYAGAKTKRRQRLRELSEELAKLVEQDCTFFVEGTAYVSTGSAVRLSNDADFLIEKAQIQDVP